MNLIVRANKEKFEEAKTMCEALEEIMKDELEAKKAEGKAEDISVLLKDLGEVPEKLQKDIMGQSNTEVLNRWLKCAARAETIQDFEQKIK